MFESIGESIKKYFEDNSEEMLKNVKQIALDNLPQIVESAKSVGASILENAKHFIR